MKIEWDTARPEVVVVDGQEHSIEFFHLSHSLGLSTCVEVSWMNSGAPEFNPRSVENEVERQ